MATITYERLRELEKYEAKLNALESHGVDNWDGYDFAMEDIRKGEEHEQFLDEIVSEIVEAFSVHLEEPAGAGCGYGLTSWGYSAIFSVLNKFDIAKKGSKQ